MARRTLVFEEVIALLTACGASKKLLKEFTERSESFFHHRQEAVVDEVTVTSGFGAKTSQGIVALTVNDQLTQMDAAKAKEIGLMILAAAEAAQSDEMFVVLLKRLGITDPYMCGELLLELREIRQGSRGVVKIQ